MQGVLLFASMYKPDEVAAHPSSDINAGVLPPSHGSMTDITMGVRNMSFSQPQLTTALVNAGPQTPPLNMHIQHPAALIPMVYGGQYAAVPLFISQHTPPRTHSATSSATSMSFSGQIYPQLAATSQFGPVHREHHNSRSGHSYRSDPRRQNATRVNRGPNTYYNQTGHHNHVDVNRIREGIDVRTTVCNHGEYLRYNADLCRLC